MGPITAIIPVSRWLTLAGRRVRVREFRLLDLARLQAVLDDLDPDPLAAVQDSLGGMDAEGRRLALVAAHEAAERGPTTYGTPEANRYFATPEGGALFTWEALRRTNPGVTPEVALELFLGSTPGEFSRLWRACHGTSTLDAIERMLMPDDDSPRPPGRTRSWPEMVDELARERGWRYRDIYRMTITEWIAARNGGAAPERGRVVRPGEDMAALAEAQRVRYYGEGGGDG